MQQNIVLIDKLKSQYEAINLHKEAMGDLVKENESHLKSIESLAKQLELYKSKSPVDVDKKVMELDTKTRQHVKKLKDETDQLSQMMKVKENKIKDLEGEISRLKLVIRTESNMKKYTMQGSSSINVQRSVLEQRVDELAESGRLEYKIYINPNISKERGQDLTKVLNSDFPSLTQAYITHLFSKLNEKKKKTERGQIVFIFVDDSAGGGDSVCEGNSDGCNKDTL